MSIEKEFGVNIGYSDHTVGLELPVAATSLGATFCLGFTAIILLSSLLHLTF